MGISMLGGIVQSILNGISSIFTTIIGEIMKLIINVVVMPVVTLIVGIINYTLGILWYSLSCFLLGLVDYVQILFRLLAGLPVDGVQMNLSSSSVEGGDLVIQLIMTDSIRDVFLSMCIVGIFLLVITTIFQIIKVEYTTEGAKNAKGPILNKAFKGLCNMVMIPALCIVGVFIGNKVLDLLDTATSKGEGATISGTLFVTAASQAFYKDTDVPVILSALSVLDSTPVILTASVNLTIRYFQDVWGSIVGKDYDIEDKLSSESQKDVAYKISCGWTGTENGTYMDYHYYNPSTITMFYDYSQINYLLLIFGACFVIKTLYYACFGMIVRLYQCGMLFIISPAVIGMTPINEGGLAKWRSEFMGQALSAYGVVMALNIFLILVEILLSIDIDFDSFQTAILGADLMVGLLKAIIVLGGCLTIEKFSGQIGGYFGAKDALAQGKEMEKGVKDTAKKAVSTAVTVAAMATGVGGAAMGAAKGLGGAMKAGSAAAKAGGGSGFLGGLKGGASHIGSGIKSGALKVTDAVEDQIQTVADGLGFNYKTRTDRNIERNARNASHEAGEAQKDLRRQEMAFDKAEASDDKEKAMYTQRLHDWKSKLAAAEASGDTKAAGIARGQITSNRNKIDSINVRQNDRIEALAKAEERVTKSKSAAADAQTALQDRKKLRSSEAITHREANRQAAKSFFNEKTFLGQNVSAVKKQISGYQDSAAKEGGDEVAAALKHLAKVESKAKEDAANARNATWIEQKNKAQEAMVKKLAIEECEIKNSQLDLLKNSGLSSLNNLQSRFEQSNDTAERTSIANQMETLKTRLADNLGIGSDGIALNSATHKFEVNGNYKLETSDLEKMFDRIFKSKKGMNDKQAIEEAVKEAIQGKNAEQAKQIQEIFEKVLQRYTKE